MTPLIISILVLSVALAAAVAAIARLSGRNRSLSAENTRLSTSIAVAEQRLEDLRTSGGDNFKAMASSVLEANSAALTDRSRMAMEAVLAPVRESIEIFTRDFKACYDTERADRHSLRQGIENLADINRTIALETNRLTHALKGDKGFQGRWGEMILSNILEHSGLEPGRWLMLQHSENTDEGRRQRPDALIRCPHNRTIVIDSKCSLTAYMAWRDAETDERRQAALKEHIQAMDKHIKVLESKAYQDTAGDGTRPDFVVMFVPHEGAYIAAMQADESLWQRAFDSRVIIASPVHLVTVVKLIEQMWTIDDRGTNARRIAEQAVKMLNKLTDAFADLARVGTQLENSMDAYQAAISKLRTGRGNVVSHVAKLAAMGARATKTMPRQFEPIDDNEAEGGDDVI